MDSGKVYTIVGGKLALVPKQHLDKINKKEVLVRRAAELHDIVQSTDHQMTADVAGLELKEIMGKIIRLNRRIPPCVQFPTEYTI